MFGSNDKKKEDMPTMSQSFLRACLLILGGIIALAIAVELLAQFWIWLVVIGAVAVVGYITFRVIQARKDRW